jgi:hypothetical protein
MEVNEILQGTGNSLIIVRRDDLIEFAAVCANRIIAAQPKTTTKQETEQPISQPEAIVFLGKSRQTLIKWRKKGVITGHVLGGRVYYLKSELLTALNKKSA